VPEATDQLARLKAALAERYRVERELGHGGMATVWLAHDLKHDRPVALKVLRPELAAVLGPERFLREVRITARLNHPHILPLLDSGEAGGFVYYAMPYVEGESLRERLARERQLPLADALRIGLEVADALSYAHSHDVVHRDVKPENILVESGHAVVADFGIARAITEAGGGRLTETGIAVGTPAYMSPEQAAGSQEVDGRSDLYSLGCVLYEMLAGHPPFTGTTAQEILARQSLDAVPRLTAARPQVPVAVEQAILAALAKIPADRFATARQLADALTSGAQGGTGVAAARHAWPARRLAVGVTAAIGIVGVVVGAALLARRNGARDAGAASRVVVMPFQNRTAITELDPLGTVAADWVAQGLTEAGFLMVLDTRSALVAAHTLGAAATPVAVGHETAAGVVVLGSYFLQSDSLQFQAKIASTSDGSILFGIGGIAAPRERPLDGVEQLRQRVLTALASLHNEDVTNFQTRLAQPPTYAAYREYAEGLELYLRTAFSEAARHFQRAAVLDSSFLTAALWAAGSWHGVDNVRLDSIMDGLQPLRHRLGRFDRARFDFVVAMRGPDPQETYRAALRMVEAAPGSEDARREAALSAMRVMRGREALRRLRELDPEHGLMRAWGDYWSALAWVHHMLGEHHEELAAARRGRQLWPSNGHFRFVELRALAALGRVVELDSAVRADFPTIPGQVGILARAIAGELLAHGHAESAHRLLTYAAQLLTARPPSEQTWPDWWQQHTHLAILSGETEGCLSGSLGCFGAPSPATWERARDEWLHQRAELALLFGDAEAAGQLAAQLRDPDAHRLLPARVAAAQGRHETARAALVRAERRFLSHWGNLQGLALDRASVLIRMGDLESALDILGEGLSRGLILDSRWGNDGHSRAELAPLWPDPRFRALIKPRG
jgi:tetratricopeptide (TPR) repeat protein